MTTKAPSRIFRFGVFEANEVTGELHKQGVRIKLHSQPFEVLIMLLERPTELVTREAMQQRLWGHDTFVDFDHGLNAAVNKLRQALRDSASEPRYVETVAGKGYRFLVPVTSETAVSTAVSTAAPPAVSPEPTEHLFEKLLTAPGELPEAPRKLVRSLLLLTQAMYLAFYLGALANLPEIHDIFTEAGLPSPAAIIAVLMATGAALIPVRLFLLAAVALDYRDLRAKFRTLFPALLLVDLLWALSPFLLVHHLSIGLALGMSAALIYMPFAQRSLVLMYDRARVKRE